MTRQMIGRSLCPFRWQPVPISPLVWVRSFIEPDLFGPKCTVRQYHSDLSDQSAQEIRVRLGLDLKMHYFSIFTENKEKQHIFFGEFH